MMHCGRVFFCDNCGSYLSKVVTKGNGVGLRAECKGLRNFGARVARDRLRKGLHPREKTELGMLPEPVTVEMATAIVHQKSHGLA